jgi:hypothetical protein
MVGVKEVDKVTSYRFLVKVSATGMAALQNTIRKDGIRIISTHTPYIVRICV